AVVGHPRRPRGQRALRVLSRRRGPVGRRDGPPPRRARWPRTEIRSGRGRTPGHDGAVPATADPPPAASDRLEPTERTTVRRSAARGRYERDVVHAILDEAYVAHVGRVVDGQPRVLPMAYGRVGDVLYLHGAVGNAMLRASTDAEVCVTVTLLDGLVLARSAYHHSMNYRSVVLLGPARKVEDPDEKRRAPDAIVDHAPPGRSAVARPADDGELRATPVLRPEERRVGGQRAH